VKPAAVTSGEAGLGLAWQGRARLGRARRGVARHGKARRPSCGETQGGRFIPTPTAPITRLRGTHSEPALRR
jgi:hypothetical protein